MTNVYEALQRARKEDVVEETREPAARVEPIPLIARGRDGIAAVFAEPRPAGIRYSPRQDRSEIEGLLARVLPIVDHNDSTVLHFVGSTPGEGVSTLAREFAFAAATAANRATLLIDADLRGRQTSKFFNCSEKPGLLDWIDRPGFEPRALQPVANSQLSVAALASERNSLSFEAEDIRAVYDLARRHFALTIVDCPAVNGSRYMGLAPQESDGVVLVVRAEKARPAVVHRCKAIIEEAGGTIIGAVFNGRKDYVPRFLYDRLLS